MLQIVASEQTCGHSLCTRFTGCCLFFDPVSMVRMQVEEDRSLKSLQRDTLLTQPPNLLADTVFSGSNLWQGCRLTRVRKKHPST